MMEEIVLALIVGLVVYFAGYFKGRADGVEWANDELSGILGTLKKINEILGEQPKNVP